MTKIPLHIFLFLLLPITLTSSSLNFQRSTLLSIKNQWGNPSALSSWNPATSPCSWTGIRCSTTSSVIEISLYSSGINFTIPSSICDLKTLRALNLSWNNIPGNFPKSLKNCSSLNTLDLSANLFVGPIPNDMDKLLPSSLQYLNLNENNFSGDIPKSIGAFKELRKLYLTQNSLDGTYPSEISNLSNLEDLQMDNNPFKAMSLPSKWGELKRLKVLVMSKCNLVGEIPKSFGGLESLVHLDLSENGLVGRIPNELFMLKGLSLLQLNDNRLSGEIPSSIQALNLSVVDLYDNELTGSIPEGFGKLTKLVDLSLFNNSLSGEIPASIGLLPELQTLKLFFNNLSGPLPPDLGSHSKFRVFEIAGNWFSGPLPENLCSRGALIGITTFSNNLSGEIPKSLEKCTTLGTLMFYNNSFTGEIPAGIWTLPALYSLMFSFNGFTGPLPDQIAKNITRLEINNNKFTGQIPKGIASWTNLQVLSAGNNMLSGPLPSGLTSLSSLQTLSLEGNQLSGELPLNINYSWPSLSTLNLARNELSGPIPAVIGSLPTLNNLDLSSNDFSGEIPDQFEQLKVISFLNLSNNKLFGEIPYSLDNRAFADSFLNNTNLCTSDKSQITTLSRCSSSLSSMSSNHLSFKHLVMILVFVVILFSVALYFTIFMPKNTTRRKYKDELTPTKFTPFHPLDFTEADIISSLYEHHVIGSGGSGKVYRVQVNDPGYSVAVKRIQNNPKFNAQFLAEVQILGDIRHTNIVKLMCCISSEKSNLLVYEFMENQSLDRWLHQKKRGDPHHVLDWPTRLRIAIGAAQGLSYMHHNCTSPIIHRDVKSSNILLDSQFNAKIADFGLAKMTIEQGELHTMSNIVGSFGYFAPEYRYTKKVNEKIDVYSFGVVLLEMATGKEPNGEDESLNLAEWCWRHCCEDKPIVDVLDEEVMKEEYFEEMSIMFKLGMMCTSPIPNTRPSMKDVVEVLRRSSQVVDGSTRLKLIGDDHVISFL